MDKILQYMPLGLVFALSTKGVVLGVTLADASIVVSLVGLLSLREYLNQNRKYKEFEEKTEKQVKDNIDHTEKKLAEIAETILKQNQIIKLQAEEYDKLRNSMSGIKLQYGVKEQFSQPKKLG